MPKIAERPINRLREATALLDSPPISAMFDKVRATVAPPPEPPPPRMVVVRGRVALAYCGGATCQKEGENEVGEERSERGR